MCSLKTYEIDVIIVHNWHCRLHRLSEADSVDPTAMTKCELLTDFAAIHISSSETEMGMLNSDCGARLERDSVPQGYI